QGPPAAVGVRGVGLPRGAVVPARPPGELPVGRHPDAGGDRASAQWQDGPRGPAPGGVRAVEHGRHLPGLPAGQEGADRRGRVPEAMKKADGGWNGAYWLGLGAPWGGLITSPADFARFCQMMLNGGELDGVRILSPATVRAMTCNQLQAMPLVPEEERRCRPW